MIVLGKDGFSEKLAKSLDSEFMRIEHRTFPDGESYLRISEPGNIRGEKAVLVMRAETPNLNADKLVVESLLALEKIKELGAKRICLLLPYMPYARQDKEFLKGEPVSVKTVRSLLKQKCDLLVSVTTHDYRKEGWLEKNRVYNVDGTDSLAEFLKNLKFKDPIVIAPDMTADRNVAKIAKAIKGNTLVLRKERDRKTGDVKTYGKIPNLRGQELIIQDDLMSSGETLYRAIQLGKKAGASRIICALVHVISIFNKNFNRLSLDFIRENCDEIYATDTIESQVSRISVIPQLAKTIKKIF